MDYAKESLRLHGEWKGKIEVNATVPVETKDDLQFDEAAALLQPLQYATATETEGVEQ